VADLRYQGSPPVASRSAGSDRLKERLLSAAPPLQPFYCRGNVAPSGRHLLPLALPGVLGARQGYALCHRPMLSDEVPCGASNIIVGRHE
jgi:hypothetical protein